MPAASILIKPVSANCNMDCKYCFYKVLCSNREKYDKGFMSEQTLETLVKEAIAYADGSLTFAFQGGEPTLAGLDFYKKAVELQQKYNTKNLQIENTLQTNGLLLDTEWAVFLRDNHFLVGLSLDGPRKIHDANRVDHIGRGTFERVMETTRLLTEHQVPFNILSVITEELAAKARYLYKFYKRNHFSHVQLIPCMDETNRCAANAGSHAVSALSYGRFLSEIFDLWYDDFMAGEDMDIRMFSNLAQMAAGYPAEQCGMNGCCNCYFVVEGDGSVYPCDFYCTDKWYLGKVGKPFHEMLRSDTAARFIKEGARTSHPHCLDCPYFSLCRVGCRRWCENPDGSRGINQLCEGYQLFFAHVWERVHKLGQLIESRYGRGNEIHI